MSASALTTLAELERAGIRLWVEGESLRYSAPLGAMTSALKERLRESKSELIGVLREQATRSVDGPAPISRDGVLEASFQQERLWLLAQLEPASSAYNVPVAIALEGPLDRRQLALALREVIDRHEILRSYLPSAGSRPRLAIAATGRSRLHRVDLRGLRADEREHCLRELLHREVRRPFSLEQGPLIRGVLFEVDSERHILLLNQHHTISDRWSTGLMLGELAARYSGPEQRSIEGSGTQPLQYADYAAWQRRRFSARAFDHHLDYWRQKLAAPLPVLELPMARPRQGAPLREAGLLHFHADADLTRRLNSLARSDGATLYLVCLAAFNVLLSRYGEQEDILVGTPVANRLHTEFEPLLGFFANMLVLRADLSGRPTFRQLLERVRRVALEAYDHQELPFEKLVEELNPERDLSRNPLFQIVFILNSDPLPRLRFGALEARPVPLESSGTKFDLLLALQETSDGIEGMIEYSSELFEQGAIERLRDRFLALLAGIAEQPQTAIDRLPLLSASERAQICDLWNATDRAFPSSTCMHELFVDRANRDQDAIAVSYGDEHLSYRALDRRSADLATRLQRLGQGPGSLVAVAFGRCTEMVVGVLGVLRAGAAYVPLDPSHPAERHRQILESAASALVLTCGGVGAAIAQGRPSVDLDRIPQPETDGIAPTSSAGAEDLAYIIFTSGSTGVPKGVVVQHRPAVNLIDWVNRSYGVGPGDRLLFTTSLGFDLSVYDVFGILAAGAEVHVADEADLGDPARLLDALTTRGISFWDSAPAALQQLVPFFSLTGGTHSFLRLVFLSGDWIPLSLPPALAPLFPNAAVIALGGATEATIWSNYFPVGEIDPRWRSIPYGTGIQNARYYALDRHLNLAPVEVPGDLYIGGGCLALGYLGQPRLTAERFRPDPFSGSPGAILYWTGDRARWQPEGHMEFLGRRDTQVKIRGFRIELGEIESVLRRHPAVRETVAIVREDRPGDRRIVAYIESHESYTASAAPDELAGELDGLAQRSLPEYMVPAAMVFVDSWPVTANGKLDRKRLPSPDLQGERPSTSPPSTASELAIAEIWCEVLGVASPGREDNFFRLGGHSLLATQAVAAVRSRLGVRVALGEIFNAPTLAGFAARVDELLAESPVVEAPLERLPREGELEPSFAQERLWFIDRLHPDSAVYNIPGAVRLDGRLDRAVLDRGVQALVDRFESLRTVFPERNGRPVQLIVPRRRQRLPVVDLTGLSAGTRRAITRRLAAQDAAGPFSLSTGPLFRSRLISLDEEHHVLLLNVHHIVADAWSIDVLLRDFAAFYAAGVEGREASLDTLTVDYADYAAWQRRRLDGDELQRQLRYWLDRLAGAPPALELPADRPRPNAFRFRGGVHTFTAETTLLGQLERIEAAHGVTRFMVLLSAFQTLLHRYTGSTDLLVGTPVANRERTELKNLVGFFVNTLVMRADLSGNPTFLTLLGRTREAVLAAFDNQSLPFERVVEEINPDRDLSRNPLFQVVFMSQNAPSEDRRLPGLELGILALENETAKFDLTLDLTVEGDRIGGRLEYNADLFHPVSMQRLTEHLRVLLSAALRSPERSLAELPLLSESERHQLVVEWNDTATPWSIDSLLHQPFERRAALTPDHVAAEISSEAISYAELERRANRVAETLIAAGLAPGERVGICLRRSLEIPVALLGILKAGGAYVPMEPGHPEDRVHHIVEQTGLRFLLYREAEDCAWAGPDRSGVAHGTRLERWIDLDSGLLPAVSSAAPPARALAEDLAYIIFTSGSTGRPKGVALQHRPVINLIEWVNRTQEVGSADRLLFVTSLCFDLSVYDIFGMLAAGGSFRVATETEIEDPRELGAVLEQGITFWDSAPAALQRLVPYFPAPSAGSRALRLIFLSGDWVPLSLPPAVSEAFPNARVVALGGATEAAIWSNYFPVGEIAPEWRSVPYGRPIQNAHYHVLDERLEPCPIGVPGALYIGDQCLSVGYAGQPALTAERYVPDPWSDRPGAVLYLTGDRARRFSDGMLEFLGRVDSQVKIRGYRVEPGEIEVVLRGVENVREAVVMARLDAVGERQLVGYVELGGPSETADPSLEHVARSLRLALREKLPEYMVPAFFGTVDHWPVTANGKLDRDALAGIPLAAGHAAAVAKVEPRTELERRLAAIWIEILGVAEVGVFDNFFELGGHSLTVAQLAARLHERLAVDLPLRRLFEVPTIAELAEEVLRAGVGVTPSPSISALGDRSVAPLSFAQERLWVEFQLDPRNAAYNVPFAVRMRGALDVAALRGSLGELLRRHGVLRSHLAVVRGAPAQILQPFRMPALPVVDLCALAESDRETAAKRLADAETLRPFDLAAENPLLRATLFSLAEDHHILVLDVHHIAFDGWSVGIFLRELSAFYPALCTGEPIRLAEPELQYADFAAWQQDPAHARRLAQEITFWREYLEGAPPFLELPTHRPRPPVMTSRGASLGLRPLSEECTARLHALSRAHGCTPFMTLTAAFHLLLFHHTRAHDVVIGTDVAGRFLAELEPMVGFFVNQVALRTRLDDDPELGQLLGRVRDGLLEVFSHQETPFSKVVEAVNPPRDRSRPPLVQLKIGFQGEQMGQLRLPGLELSEYPLGGQTAKFDLWLNLWESNGRLMGRLEYSLDAVAPPLAHRFLRQYERLLEGLDERLGRRLSEVDEEIATWELPAASEGVGALKSFLLARRLTRRSSPALGEGG